jgi:hypothetical protein
MCLSEQHWVHPAISPYNRRTMNARFFDNPHRRSALRASAAFAAFLTITMTKKD